jgi:hypothetical protein
MQKAGRLPGLFVLLCIIAWCDGCTGAVPGTPVPAETPATEDSTAQFFQDNTFAAAVTSSPVLSNLPVFFVPVRQGDVILVITPEQKTVLIDAA